MKKVVLVTLVVGVLLLSVPSFADTVILPHRVFDGRTGTVVDFEGLRDTMRDG